MKLNSYSHLSALRTSVRTDRWLSMVRQAGQNWASTALLTIALCFWGAIRIDSARAADPAKKLPWTVINKQIEPIPLEYQAVVFRRTARNETEESCFGAEPQQGAWVSLLKRPSDGEPRPVQGDILGFNRLCVCGISFNRPPPFELKPGYESSVTYASAANWKETLVEPLLPEPGKYTFVFEHGDRLDFVVRAAKGRDKAIRDQLRTNPPLAEAMLSPDHAPVASVVPAIKRIIELYPESSYADYARFALARSYALPLQLDASTKLSAEVKTEVLDLLKSINPKFAYAPHAMVLRHKLLAESEPLEADYVLGQLRMIHPDSAEVGPRVAVKSPDAAATEKPRTKAKKSEAKK